MVARCRQLGVGFIVGAVLGRFTFGYIVSVGIAATIFILAVQWAGKKWPNAPVLGSTARALRGGA